MIISLIAGLSILLLTGVTNTCISYYLFVDPAENDPNESS